MATPVLLVEDDRGMGELVRDALRTEGFEVRVAVTAEEAFAELERREFDVVVTDLRLPGLNGLELCDRVVKNRPGVPVVVMTAFGSLETAVQAIRAGAYDFVSKPIEMDVLALVLRRAAEHRALSEQVRLLTDAVAQGRPPLEELIGESEAMHRVREEVARVAAVEASVLVTGESGTGKEVVARALHRLSPRRDGPFVAIDCSSLPEALLESELFGHVRGAFTGAREPRAGLLVHAAGGVVLLDEIGDMPIALQPKLLRALETFRVRPVGADEEVSFDVRIVAATNRDLEAAIEEGRFREDLYYRFNVIQLELPPLRARGADVLALAQHFLERFAARTERAVKGLSEAVAERLLAYPWPGNVRELRNAMERAVALTRFDAITVEDLPKKVRSYQRRQLILGDEDPSELVTLEEVERRYILHVVAAVGGNKALAARTLGIDRKTLYRKLERFEAAGD